MPRVPAAQTYLVGEVPFLPQGVEVPEINYRINDLGVLTDERLEKLLLGQVGPVGDELWACGVSGWCAIGRRGGIYHAFDRNDMNNGIYNYPSRQQAVERLRTHVGLVVTYWLEKVAWYMAGDTVPPGMRGGRRDVVIRAGGHHYTIGPEPANAARLGRQYAFRLFKNDEVIQSRAVYHQGRIPKEFVRLLPDNAERILSDEDARRQGIRPELMKQVGEMSVRPRPNRRRDRSA